MTPWSDTRFLDLVPVRHPLLLAPMAGAGGIDLALAVSKAGGLAALPCASLSVEQARAQISAFRAATNAPLNLNFFAHDAMDPTPDVLDRWRQRLAPYYHELGVSRSVEPASGGRAPFSDAMCALVEEMRPEVVSFHFGLPSASLLDRVRATGATILSSATTVAEGRWLAERGVDAIIAQGVEAGGHRATFLGSDMACQPSLFALLPQLVDAVAVPIIAAGAVADGRAMAAALALGASAVQAGTAFLASDQSLVAPVHRTALSSSRDDGTAITNLFTGRPARGLVNRLMCELGPMSDDVPPFPHAAAALAPLRVAAEAQGSGDFQPLWAGQAVALSRGGHAEAIASRMIDEARALLR